MGIAQANLAEPVLGFSLTTGLADKRHIAADAAALAARPRLSVGANHHVIYFFDPTSSPRFDRLAVSPAASSMISAVISSWRTIRCVACNAESWRSI